MTPRELKSARKRLGLSQAGMARALRLRGADARRTVRRWETGDTDVPGPVAVAVECMISHGLKAPP